jgi:hypothetical protein
VRTYRRCARRHLTITRPRRVTSLGVAVIVVASMIASAGCAARPDGDGGTGSAAGSSDPSTDNDARFPDVVDATASYDGATGTWSFAVTMTSPYDTPERYADGWRVMTTNGTVLGTHTLLHDHAEEQPFTRTQTGVEIPGDVDTVVVEGRDQANGFGGATVTITLGR